MAESGSLADILVKLKANVDGFKAGMQQADQSVESVRLNLGRLNIAGGQGISLFSRFGITMGELAQVAGFLLLVNQMHSLVSTGHQFNIQLEQMVLGIKAVVAANSTITDAQGRQVAGADRLRIAGNAVAEQIDKMKTDALLTTATLQQIVEAFQGAIPPATAIGLSLDDTRKVVVAIVQAAGAIGLPMQQVSIEVREILAGTIHTQTRLAKVLGLTNEMVNKWKQQGDFASQLLTRMDAFTIAGKEAGDTWVGVTSSLQDFKEQLTGAAVQPAVELIRQQLIGVRDALGSVRNGVFVFRQEVKDAVAGAQEFLVTLTRGGINLVQFGIDAVKSGSQVAQFVNTWTGGAAGWVLQILAMMAAGNLAIGVFVKLGSVVGILGQALFSASGLARLLPAALAAVEGTAIATNLAAGARSAAWMGQNMTSLMTASALAAPAVASAGKSAAYMASNMTSLMSSSGTSMTLWATIVAAFTTKWVALLGYLKALPAVLASWSAWLVSTPAGWVALATALTMIGVGYAAMKLYQRDTRTEHEKLVESFAKEVTKSEEARMSAAGRLQTAKALLEVLKKPASPGQTENESKTRELEAREAIASASSSIEDLIPFLGEERVNREEIIKLIERQIPLLESGEVDARNVVVQAISNQVKEMDKYIKAKREEIEEEKRLIALKGGAGAPQALKDKLLASEKELLAEETKRMVMAKKGEEELAKPTIASKKATDDSRTTKARYDNEEAQRKEALSAQMRDIAEEEAVLAKKKELGFVTEKQFLLQSMALHKQKSAAVIEADKLELEAKLALYEKEGKKEDDKSALKQQHATKIAEKESEMRREELKNETQLTLDSIKLRDTASAARLKGAQSEMEIQQARFEGAKALGLLTEKEIVGEQRLMDQRKFAAEEQRLREQIITAVGVERRIALESDLGRLQADRQAKEIRHEAELAKIRKELAIRGIEDAATAQSHAIAVEQAQLSAQSARGTGAGDEAEPPRVASVNREVAQAQEALDSAYTERSAVLAGIAKRKASSEKAEEAEHDRLIEAEYRLQRAIVAASIPLRDTSKEEARAESRKKLLPELIQQAQNFTNVTQKGYGDAGDARDKFFDANSELVEQTITVRDAITGEYSKRTEMVAQIKQAASYEYSGFVARSGNAIKAHFDAGMRLRDLKEESGVTSAAHVKMLAEAEREYAVHSRARDIASDIVRKREEAALVGQTLSEEAIAQTAKEVSLKVAAEKAVGNAYSKLRDAKEKTIVDDFRRERAAEAADKKRDSSVERRLAQMAAEAKLTMDQIDLDEKRATESESLVRRDLENKISAEEKKRELMKAGTPEAMNADRAIANLQNELRVKEINGIKEVTDAHIKAAEQRYQAAEASLRKQLDFENNLRSSSLESLNLIQRYMLSQKLGVGMLELPEKFEKIPAEARTKLTKQVRSEPIHPGALEGLYTQAQEQFGGELKAGIGKTQSIAQFEELFKGLMEFSKMKGSEMQLGPLGGVLGSVATRTPTEFTEGFTKSMLQLDVFSKLKDQATVGFDAITSASATMFSALKTQGDEFSQSFMTGKLPDLVFENVYGRLVNRLEEEFARG